MLWRVMLCSTQAKAERLARISAQEMVAALGLSLSAGPLQALATAPFLGLSRRLGSALARFDDAIPSLGLSAAALAALRSFGVDLDSAAAIVPRRGALCILANHPGAYDALALLAACRRDDIRILAAERTFLRALPNFCERHLCLVEPEPTARSLHAVRSALAHLTAGGALLHFPAGQIEPDAAFHSAEQPLLRAWAPSSERLLESFTRARAELVLGGISGVHSAQAKRNPLNRWFERRNITTFAPLLQVALSLRDVRVTVRFALARERPFTVPQLRAQLHELLTRR